MHHLFSRTTGRRKKLIDWLAFDSWIDSSFYDLSERFKDWWSNYSSFFGRFHITGTKRFLTEIVSEGVTLGTAGFAVMLAFAIPAFEKTTEAWKAIEVYSVTFLDRYGNEIGKRGILRDDAVPLEEVPDHMIKATLATEDRRFYDHFGVDILGTLRAMIENIRANDVVQGGSSITQQLAKNLFLSSERSLERKIKEAFLALWLEARLSKQEILKLYLDRAYMGGGAFGIEAASVFYFGKSVRDVNLAEAAMLAGLYKAPTKFAPHVDLSASRARAGEVLSNMVEAGFMTEGQVHGARLNPAQIIVDNSENSPNWFLDWAFDEVQRIMKGKDDYVVTVQTTVDIELQKIAEQAVVNTLRLHGRARQTKQGALVSMEIDGAVRALVGGRDYGESQFNRATKAIRQPGSSFKPYVYYTALENGYHSGSIVTDGHVSCGRWSPKNYSGGFRGRMTVATALMRSVNTVAVKLSLKVGREKVIVNVNKMGLHHIRKSCSMALGDTGVTVLQHTAGYAHFASGGKSVRPYGVLEIRNSKSELIYAHEKEGPRPVQVLDREKVDELNSILALVVSSGTGRRAQLDFTTAVGKTGTSSSYRDAWFMGFTGQYVTGVWFGNDNYQPTGRVTGGNLPAMAWKQYMTLAHATPNIPVIPGISPDENQISYIKRIITLKKKDPPLQKPDRVFRHMSSRTRQVLSKITKILKQAQIKWQDGNNVEPVRLSPKVEPVDKKAEGHSEETSAAVAVHKRRNRPHFSNRDHFTP